MSVYSTDWFYDTRFKAVVNYLLFPSLDISFLHRASLGIVSSSKISRFAITPGFFSDNSRHGLSLFKKMGAKAVSMNNPAVENL